MGNVILFRLGLRIQFAEIQFAINIDKSETYSYLFFRLQKVLQFDVIIKM